MNAEAELFDQPVDPIDPRGTGFFGLKGAADGVAAVYDREDNRMKQRLIFGVEWAVDEDVCRVPGWSLLPSITVVICV